MTGGRCAVRLGGVLWLGALGLGLAQSRGVSATMPGAKQEVVGTLPQYDVVSVKENKGASKNRSWRTTPDGFITDNIQLLSLISSAYGIRMDLISGGPEWIRSVGFDVTAKVAGADVEALKKMSNRQRGDLLRPVLAERFGLKVHPETKMLPVYNLVVAKGGVKMKASPPDPPLPAGTKPGEPLQNRFGMSLGPGTWKGTGYTTDRMADQLSYMVGRTVLDKTGLTGRYEVNLKWAEEHGPADNGAESGPSIYTAVQEQLGLKLEPSKGPVETLVIDAVQRPSEN